MKKIAVLLSGIGNKDGSECLETISLVIALSSQNCHVEFFAPDINYSPLNFITETPLPETRNVLIESARLTRGKIHSLSDCQASDFEALAIPGGMGAGTILSTWVKDQAKFSVLPEVEKLIQDFHRQSKPIAALCLAPVLVAKALKTEDLSMTTGSRKNEAGEILSKMNVSVEDCPPSDYITDRYNKVLTSPCYMHSDAKPHEVFKGISGLVREFVEMA